MCINVQQMIDAASGKSIIIPEDVSEHKIKAFLQICPGSFQAEIVKTNRGVGITYIQTEHWSYDPMLSEIGEFLGDSIHPEITTGVKIL